MPTIKCCFKCTERSLGCHSTCERYLKEKENIHKIYEAKAHEHSVLDGIYRRRK